MEQTCGNCLYFKHEPRWFKNGWGVCKKKREYPHCITWAMFVMTTCPVWEDKEKAKKICINCEYGIRGCDDETILCFLAEEEVKFDADHTCSDWLERK